MKRPQLTSLIGALCVCFLLLTISFTVVALTPAFYPFLQDASGVTAVLDSSVAQTQAQGVRGFLLHDEKTSDLQAFTNEERAHMHDVRALIDRGFFFAALSCIVLLILALDAGERGLWHVFRSETLRYGAMLCGGVVIICAIAALNFDALFLAFHEIFFPQGNYLFAYDSALITLFPEKFFMFIASAWGLVLLLLAAGAYAVGRRT